MPVAQVVKKLHIRSKIHLIKDENDLYFTASHVIAEVIVYWSTSNKPASFQDSPNRLA